MRGRAPLRGTCGCDSGLMGAGSEHTGEPLAPCNFATGVLTCHLPTVVLALHLLPAARVRAVAEPPFVLAWCPEGRATLLGLEALSRTGVESHTARRVLASGRGRGRSTGGSAAGGGNCGELGLQRRPTLKPPPGPPPGWTGRAGCGACRSPLSFLFWKWSSVLPEGGSDPLTRGGLFSAGGAGPG